MTGSTTRTPAPQTVSAPAPGADGDGDVAPDSHLRARTSWRYLTVGRAVPAPGRRIVVARVEHDSVDGDDV